MSNDWFFLLFSIKLFNFVQLLHVILWNTSNILYLIENKKPSVFTFYDVIIQAIFGLNHAWYNMIVGI